MTERAPADPAGGAAASHGLEVGSVSVKWVRRTPDGAAAAHAQRHEGDPAACLRAILEGPGFAGPWRAVITGQAARALLNLPYRPETECLERALAFRGALPDILLSLGGETFTAYGLKQGRIRNTLSTSKCAAGTGEFIVQQLQRMGLSLRQGLEAARGGRVVPLASRCSVHCKSDATHKLNKGECRPGDIARTLIASLAGKVGELVELLQWPRQRIVVCGGMVSNPLFMETFRALYPDARVDVLPESACLEAFGAALFAGELPGEPPGPPPARRLAASPPAWDALPPLAESEPLLDYRVAGPGRDGVNPADAYILAVDAGSTTTKAVLFNERDGSVGARCYLRTLGNPVQATRHCLETLLEAPGVRAARVVQAGVTGSGREVVSVFLQNAESFNEILAHARAAVEAVPEVETVFEIGGQDSKYISFERGVPVDYAMNEGCSAGTGSFIEESASVDMNIAMEEISAVALSSRRPIAFGERCAAFINTDLRNALQQGARQEDVVAGLACSVADNYVSRVVGPRRVAEPLLFLGGVARNRAVALALAARTGQRVVVPPHPELMGAVGVALRIRDRLRDGSLSRRTVRLADLLQGRMQVRGTFRCRSCDNRCEIRTLEIQGRTYPFGGLCSRYEIQRHGGTGAAEGRDLVAVRNRLMFETFGPRPVDRPRSTVGLPLALTAWELFPLYVRLIEELGFAVLLPDPALAGDIRTSAPICYPCQILHGAVRALLRQGADHILVPHLLEMESGGGALHGYTCPSTALIPDILRAAFPGDAGRFLSPHMGLSADLAALTLREAERMAERLGLQKEQGARAAEAALGAQRAFRRRLRETAAEELAALRGEPAVVLAGRPYVVCSPGANLSLPRKIASRGFHVLPADMLPDPPEGLPPRDVWHFTRQIGNAVAHVRHDPDLAVCLVSCFSCGPDSSMYHAFREKLAGHTFCYLEIDSHTAHAGFETRVGAFLDLLEEQRRRRANPPPPAAAPPGAPAPPRPPPGAPARLAPEKDALLDSRGDRVAYDDPRVTHVWTGNHAELALRMIRKVYAKCGRPLRVTRRTDARVMQEARKLCSGRECIPMTAAVGAVLWDVRHHRRPGEITVYYALDQEGPCQNGAWPLVWETINRRLGKPDILLGVWPVQDNHYLGLGNAFNLAASGALFLGDLFEEARNTLACLAARREEALQRFERAFARFLERFPPEEGDLEPLLSRWAAEMAGVPLTASPEDTPRVLIIGGLNLLSVHDPVESALLELGVLPKVVPYAEGMCWLASESLVRYGLKHGLVRPGEQYARPPRSEDRLGMVRARQSKYGVNLIDSFEKKARDAMAPSGLLFDEHIPFPRIVEAGHRYATHNGFTETSVTVGRYLCALETGRFHGIVNLGSFNCQPAMNSQAILRPLANVAPVPYAALDCEGPWISTSQRRVLETLAVQARRAREEARRRGGPGPSA